MIKTLDEIIGRKLTPALLDEVRYWAERELVDDFDYAILQHIRVIVQADPMEPSRLLCYLQPTTNMGATILNLMKEVEEQPEKRLDKDL